jgi:hypothetical protein
VLGKLIQGDVVAAGDVDRLELGRRADIDQDDAALTALELGELGRREHGRHKLGDRGRRCEGSGAHGRGSPQRAAAPEGAGAAGLDVVWIVSRPAAFQAAIPPTVLAS